MSLTMDGRWFLIILITLTLAACAPAITAMPSVAPQVPTPAPTFIPLTEILIPTVTPLSALPTETPTPSSPTGQAGLSIGHFEWIDEQSAWGINPNDWRLLHTVDGGLTWQDVTPEGVQVSQISALDANNAWTSRSDRFTGDDSVYRTRDGGKTWESFPVSFTIGEVQFLDANNGWAIDQHYDCGAGNCWLELYRSYDGGKSWEQVLVRQRDGSYLEGWPPGTLQIPSDSEVGFSSPDTIWRVGGLWINNEPSRTISLSVSWDAGQTWQDQRVPIPESIPEASLPERESLPVFLNPKEGYFTVTYSPAGSSRQGGPGIMAFFYTQDGGHSWTARPAVAPVSYFHRLADIVSINDIFVDCGESLCASHDGASSWIVIPSNLLFNSQEGRTLIDFDFVSPSTGYAIVSQPDGSYALYKTSDGGRTWELRPPL
jgi:photosystem II stability/assembly factor-like uncharacterized protein